MENSENNSFLVKILQNLQVQIRQDIKESNDKLQKEIKEGREDLKEDIRAINGKVEYVKNEVRKNKFETGQ